MAAARSVLFVCTGNIFRSMTAEYALRRAAPAQAISVASAGTEDDPGLTVWPEVAAYLADQGLDVSGHQRRTLDRVILDGADLIVAMNTDHQDTMRQRFGLDAPLFTEVAGSGAEPLPDVSDLFQPRDYHSPAAIAHAKATMDRIIAEAPRLAARLNNEEI